MAEEENETNTPPEEDQPDPSSESGSEEQTPEPQGDAEGDSEETGADGPTDDEAAALAAAMAAINQVQGVADSAIADSEPQADAQPFESPEFGHAESEGPKEGMDLLSDVHMNVRIELGRTKMFVEDVLKLSDGAVVELDKLAGDPVDVFVNNRKVAKGEVLVLNDLFCVRINEIVDISSSAT